MLASHLSALAAKGDDKTTNEPGNDGEKKARKRRRKGSSASQEAAATPAPLAAAFSKPAADDAAAIAAAIKAAEAAEKRAAERRAARDAAKGSRRRSRVRRPAKADDSGDLRLPGDESDGSDADGADKPRRKRSRGLDPGAAASEPEERLARTVFVGNLPVKVKAAQVKRLFGSASDSGNAPSGSAAAGGAGDGSGGGDGDDDPYAPRGLGIRSFIESVRFRSAALEPTAVAPGSTHKTMRKAAFIQGKFEEGRDNMNAYVVFKDEASAKRALALDGAVVSGRHLRVDIAAAPGKVQENRSVFVGNLPFDVKDDDLWRFFGRVCMEGEDALSTVRVVRDRVTNQGKGIAFVEFEDKLSMAQALGANGTKFKGRELRVTKVSKKPRRDKPGSSFEGVRSGHVPRSLGKLGVGAKRRKEEKARRNARSDRNAIKKIAQHAKAARKASTKGKGRR